ncbi:hypothetical protein FHS18_006593 [Paenibacillus phyllosphaerae]|uniref:Uncharacterized protein n=1 Tax=Paenibacillus phyllosphaerae TaxID=274593 RepID=A0A7W5B4X2_9BACL|nr:hypothetical protein [Paenibacillus phyllosphaerae]MBB3114472.1 hypothetical protein [Paenibacillus phyllosphaerae]
MVPVTANVHVRATFQAVVDAVIPSVLLPTCRIAPRFIEGAVQLGIDLFVIMQIDHSQFVPVNLPSANQEPLSQATAQLLDLGAAELVRTNQDTAPLNPAMYPGGGLFASMSRIDRLRTITLLNHVGVPLGQLPLPYQNHPGLVQTMMDSLHQLTMFGYYSEWYGYGTTRLLAPVDQKVEFDPPSWPLIGYPGPAYGYRALRGFVLAMPDRRRPQ